RSFLTMVHRLSCFSSTRPGSEPFVCPPLVGGSDSTAVTSSRSICGMLVGLHLDEEVAMLGDKLGNVKGKIVLRRVLPGGAGGPRTESSQRGSGTLLGVECQETGTYESEFRSDGTVFGSGQGIYMGKGGEVATWAGSGVGVLSPGGGISFR